MDTSHFLAGSEATLQVNEKSGKHLKDLIFCAFYFHFFFLIRNRFSLDQPPAPIWQIIMGVLDTQLTTFHKGHFFLNFC